MLLFFVVLLESEENEVLRREVIMYNTLVKLRAVLDREKKGKSFLRKVTRFFRGRPSPSVQVARDVVSWLVRWHNGVHHLFYDVIGKVEEEIGSVLGVGYYLSTVQSAQQEAQTLLPCLLCLYHGNAFHYLTLQQTKLVCYNVSPSRYIDVVGYKSELLDYVHYAITHPDVVDNFKTLWEEYVVNTLNELGYDAEPSKYNRLRYLLIDKFSPRSPYASQFGFTVSALVYVFRVGVLREFVDMYLHSDIVSSVLHKFENSGFIVEVEKIEEEIEEIEERLEEGLITKSEAEVERRRLEEKYVETLMQFLSSLKEDEFDLVLTFAKEHPNIINIPLP